MNLRRSATMAVCFVSSVPHFVQISQRTINVSDVRLMTSCELASGSVFCHMLISARSRCIFTPNFVQIYSSGTEILAFYEIQYVRRLPYWFCSGKSWDHSQGLIHGVKFRHDRLCIVQVKSKNPFENPRVDMDSHVMVKFG